MKKLISIAILFIFSVSAHAAVTVVAARTGSNSVGVSYTVTGPNSVRAFALDILANNSKTITGVTCANANYYIYPGSIAITSGSVSATGTCVCDATKFPGKGQGGIGTSGVTVEMGSLYTGGTPAGSGTLLTFTVSSLPTTITIATNEPRGGVTMENPDENPNVTFTGWPNTVSCYTGPRFDDWIAVGQPQCWCSMFCPRQCHGDATCTQESTKTHYWVGPADLGVLLAAWQKTPTQIRGQTYNGILLACTDFTQTEESSKTHYRVGPADLSILLTNWQKSNLPLPDCP